MRNVNEVIGYIRNGHILTILGSNDLEDASYSACFAEYDGNILVDVKEVEIGDFLEQIPNIKSKVDNSYYYQVKYDFDKKVYQSAIIHKVRCGGYKEPFYEEVVEGLVTENDCLFTGIIELDTKIANNTSCLEIIEKKKELVS